MRSLGNDSPIDDIGYLSRSEHRLPMLVSLTDRPRSRSELCELAEVSSSTARRTVNEFEDRTWVRKVGYRYVATRLGAAVAAGMEDLLGLFETERKLRDIWHWLPEGVTSVPPDRWSEMTVTRPEPDSPYRPVNRFKSLLQEATEVRYLRPEVALMEPCFDVLRSLLDAGVDVTLIDRPSCHAYFISTYPERSLAMENRETFTVLEHEDLPRCGIGLLDDRVTISCYEEDSGSVQALIDTDVPAVREWAESTYETVEDGARPVHTEAYLE